MLQDRKRGASDVIFSRVSSMNSRSVSCKMDSLNDELLKQKGTSRLQKNTGKAFSSSWQETEELASLLLCYIWMRQKFREHLDPLTLFWTSSLSAEICLRSPSFCRNLSKATLCHLLPFFMASPISESNCSSPGSIRESNPRRLLLWEKGWGCSQATQEHFFLHHLHSFTTRENEGVWNLMASSTPWSASVVQEQVSLPDANITHCCLPRASLQSQWPSAPESVSSGLGHFRLSNCFKSVLQMCPEPSLQTHPQNAARWALGHILTVLQKSKWRFSLCI